VLTAGSASGGMEVVAAPDRVGDRIRGLRQEIARHDDLYFRLAAPEISDFEYDRLKAELRRLEELYPEFKDDLSAGAQVGDDRTGAFVARRHLVPMLSLDKAMSEGELQGFHRRMADSLGRESITYRVEPKFDGIAISLTYEGGRL